MRYTKDFKLEQQNFGIQIEALFEQLGAVKSTERYGLTMQTKVGPYHVNIYPGDSKTELGWVAGRFDNILAAQQLLGKGMYDPGSVGLSGKWNHHFFEGWTAEMAVAEMKRQLQKIL